MPKILNRRNNLLVVDDDELVLAMLRKWLANETPYQCFFASNGEEALKIHEAESIDVMLTDVRMPGMSGIELIHHMKQMNPDIQIIIMTGYTEIDSAIKALREGVVDFFRKPFKMTTVIECLNRTFQRLNISFSRQEASRYMVTDTRTFRIPNDFNVAGQVSLELTKHLAEQGFSNESIMESIRVALNEMIINAIEHGNLELTYEHKNELIEDFENYSQFIEKRTKEVPFKDRYVDIQYSMTPEKVVFRITDEGKGFDHSTLPDPTDPENLLSCNGRGILMAKLYMDEVSYNEKGNQVELIKYHSNGHDKENDE